MTENRNELLASLFLNLKEIYQQLHDFTNEIREISSTYFEQFYTDNKLLIETEVNKLNTNIEQIKQYNCQATEEINKWLSFSNDSQEAGKTFYPIKYFVKRFQLTNNIKIINKKIYRISVENRLAKENLKKIERSIESNILNGIKKSGIYKDYEELLRTKEELISDIKYIASTLPSPPEKIDLKDIDFYISKKSLSL